VNEDLLRDLLPRLVELRRDLHRHPELGFEEHRTQGVVGDWLRAHGYAPRAVAGTGLCADLHPGSEGPTVALRADLDALPMTETTALPHRSEHEGRAHKCGHDGHTAILCGVAAVLAAGRGALPGNVRLLFQPAEEGVRGGGAKVMVGEGVLDGVREVYGLHNWPGFPKGEVRVTEGPTMAEVWEWRLRLVGRGGHASEPQVCRDPIAAGAQLVSALHTIPSRDVGHGGGAVLSVTAFQAGTTHNVIPGEARLMGTVRCFDGALGERVVDRLREVVDGACRAMRVEPQLQVDRGFPVLVNDPECAAAVHGAAAAVVGEGRVSADGLPLAAAEDFAYFARQVPGAYFFLGAGRPGEQTPGCHHPDFDFDDDLLGIGVRVFAELVARRLRRGG
jgi:amidohydrolase